LNNYKIIKKYQEYRIVNRFGEVIATYYNEQKAANELERMNKNKRSREYEKADNPK